MKIPAIPSVLGLQEVAIAAAIALAVGLAGGAYLAHAFYSPRLALKDVQIQNDNRLIQSLGQNVKDQNEAIGSLKLVADARAKLAQAALKQAAAARLRADTDAERILAAEPAPGQDRCTAASDLVRKELAQ